MRKISHQELIDFINKVTKQNKLKFLQNTLSSIEQENKRIYTVIANIIGGFQDVKLSKLASCAAGAACLVYALCKEYMDVPEVSKDVDPFRKVGIPKPSIYTVSELSQIILSKQHDLSNIILDEATKLKEDNPEVLILIMMCIDEEAKYISTVTACGLYIYLSIKSQIEINELNSIYEAVK